MPDDQRGRMTGDRSRYEVDRRVLGHSRRRETIRCLADSDGVQSVDALAYQVSVHEAAGTPDPREGATAATVRIALYHVHLPILDQANVVAFDPQRKRVEQGRAFEEFAQRVLD